MHLIFAAFVYPLAQALPPTATVAVGGGGDPEHGHVDWLFYAKVLGCLIGILLGFIYVVIGWHSRDAANTSIRNNARVKTLLYFLGQNGIGAGLMAVLPKDVTLCGTLWMDMATVATAVVLIVFVAILGFFYAYASQKILEEKWSSGIYGFLVGALHGPVALPTFIKEEILNIHEVSKQALSNLICDVEDEMLGAPSLAKNKEEFSRFFTSIVGLMLHSFFQHHKDEHPDYCACYYKYCETTELFYPVTMISGSEQYAVGKTARLGKASRAYQCLTEGRIVAWHRDDKDAPAPVPAIGRKKMVRFICIPVPPGENNAPNLRRGVICIDSSKPGYHFSDKYHRNVLVWLAYKISQLDKILLVNDKEWITNDNNNNKA